MTHFYFLRPRADRLHKACLSLCITLVLLSACKLAATPVPDENSRLSEAVPTPVQVKSTWQSEIIANPAQYTEASPHWLVMDSQGHPHLAYGGNQLNYAWFDGTAWQHEIASAEPGAGMYAALALDDRDVPHILHAVGLPPQAALVHTYRGPAGWHSETIIPKVCGGLDFDLQFDPQGILAIVYTDGGEDCSHYGVASSRIIFIQQAANGWDSYVVAQPGLEPSLAFDPTGRVYISYTNVDFGLLNLAVRENQAWTITQVKQGLSVGVLTTRLLIDAESRVHIFYSSTLPPGDVYQESLEHAWQDGSGWHFETLHTVTGMNPQISASAAPQGRITVFYADRERKLWQQTATGWEETLIPGEGDRFFSPVLAVDQQGNLALAYIDKSNAAIVYAVKQPDGWHTTRVDQGDGLDWTSTALAFGPEGQMHTVYYSQRGVNYAWKEADTWSYAMVAARRGREVDLAEPISLLVDGQNQAHIFYRFLVDGEGGLLHAFQTPAGWITETVPVEASWSRPVLSPEGWPVLLQIGYEGSALVYRTADGWQTQAVAGMKNGSAEIAYYPQQPPAGDGSLSLPYILFQGGPSQEITLRDPGRAGDLVLPAAESTESTRDFWLGFEGPGEPVVLTYTDQKPGPGDLLPVMGYFTWEAKGWTGFERADQGVPMLPAMPSDIHGAAHYVTETYQGQNGIEVSYLVGKGLDWQITPLVGDDLPEVKYVTSTAVDFQTGKFCILFNGLRENAVILTCLERLE